MEYENQHTGLHSETDPYSTGSGSRHTLLSCLVSFLLDPSARAQLKQAAPTWKFNGSCTLPDSTCTTVVRSTKSKMWSTRSLTLASSWTMKPRC